MPMGEDREGCLAMRMATALSVLLALLVVAGGGCMAKVTVNKRPNLALPIYADAGSTNPV